MSVLNVLSSSDFQTVYCDNHHLHHHEIRQPAPAATITFVCFNVSGLTSVPQLPVPLLPLLFHSKLDYCNSLYYKLPNYQLSRLQQIPNSVAGTVVKSCHITPINSVNHTTVTDPTIRQPGFDLPRRTWSLLNHFRTGQGPCRANLHKWGLAQSPSCDCGQRQTMNHIVDTCPLTKFEGGLNLLHEADDDAVIWLESTATAALAK